MCASETVRLPLEPALPRLGSTLLPVFLAQRAPGKVPFILFPSFERRTRATGPSKSAEGPKMVDTERLGASNWRVSKVVESGFYADERYAFAHVGPVGQMRLSSR